MPEGPESEDVLMYQETYNLFLLLTIAALSIAVFSLRYEYERFRKDVIRILGSLGIMVVNGSQGMTVKVEERTRNERIR